MLDFRVGEEILMEAVLVEGEKRTHWCVVMMEEMEVEVEVEELGQPLTAMVLKIRHGLGMTMVVAVVLEERYLGYLETCLDDEQMRQVSEEVFLE